MKHCEFYAKLAKDPSEACLFLRASNLPQKDLEKLTTKLFQRDKENLSELIFSTFQKVCSEMKNPPIQYDLESLL